MPSNRNVSLVLLLMLLTGDILDSDAQWAPPRVLPSSSTLSESFLNPNLGAAGILQVVLTNTAVNFSQGLETDTAILPGTCTSSSASNEFGWRRYAAVMMPVGSVVVSPPLVYIQLTPQPGFSPTTTETVTCGIGTISSKTGKSYAIGQIGPVDQYVSFTIESFSGTIAMRPTLDAIPQCTTSLAVSSITEMTIRQDPAGWGFTLCIVGDNWNPNIKVGLMKTFQCSSDDPAACAWFLSALQLYSSINASTDPEIIRVKIPYAATRSFNTNASLTVTFNPPIGTAVYGLKNRPTTLQPSDKAFSIAAYTGSKATVAIKTYTRSSSFFDTVAQGPTMRTTEDCLRGWDRSNTCPPAFWIKLLQYGKFFDMAGRILQFAVPNVLVSTRDMNEIGIFSPSNGYLNGIATTLTTVATPSPIVGTGNANYDLFINTTGLGRYQIDSTESIAIALPFSVMLSLEPPTNNVSVIVDPSPGHLICPFAQGTRIFAQDIWNGGMVMNLTVGGESWIPDVLDSFVNLTVGARTVWNDFRSCIFPNSSVVYLNSSSGAANVSVLQLSWQACPEYPFVTSTFTQVEVVTFNFSNASIFGSRLPLSGGLNYCQLVVISSPSTFAVVGVLSVNALQINEGKLTIDLVLQGGSAFSNTDRAGCYNGLLSALASTANDPSGWSNRTVAAEILPFSALNQLSATTMRLTLQPSPSFYTLKGDAINFTAMPGPCYGQVSTVSLPPNQTYLLNVFPLRGVVEMLSNDSTVDVRNLTASQLRVGGFDIIFRVRSDTFDLSDPPKLANTILSSFATTSLQPFGFASLMKKLFLVGADSLTPSEIRLHVVGTLAYAVSSPEFVVINVNRSWMTSGVDPVNVGTFNTSIYPSRGTVTLNSWYGDGTGGVVTELDVRNGLLWFEFVLIGDQWRQERDVYLDVFAGSQRSSPTAFSSLAQQLLPSISFFQFSTAADGAQSKHMRLQFQATELYDIMANELVTITFSQNTVSSGLAPQAVSFRPQNMTLWCPEPQSGALQFCVQASRGRVIPSGFIGDLNEQVLRRGGAEIFLSLFGETWLPTASICLRNRLYTTNPDNAAVIQSTVLPLDGSGIRVAEPHLLTITLTASTSYQLNSAANDTIVLNMSAMGPCVASGLPPWPDVVAIPILPRTGELVLARMVPASLTEETLRQDQIVLQISLDGDAWNRVYAQQHILELLQGFSSSLSPIQAPHGFSALSGALLQLGLGQTPEFSVTMQSLTVTLKPQANYDIDESEIVSFTLPSVDFVESGVMPNPPTISFLIAAVPKVIVLQYLPLAGQFDALVLAASIADALSMPSTNGINVNVTGKIGASFIVYLTFTPAPSPFDSRSSVQLTAMFLALTPSFLANHLQVSCAFVLGQAALETACADLSTTAAGANATSTRDFSIELAVWGGSSLVFIGILVVVTVYCVRIQQGSLSGGVRKIQKPTRANKIRFEEALDDDYQNKQKGITTIRRPQSLRDFALGSARVAERRAASLRYRGESVDQEVVDERNSPRTEIPIAEYVAISRRDFRSEIQQPSLDRQKVSLVDRGLSLTC